ncbi:MAG: SRPBCC family protein [Chloroflexi bacterium]|nr:SRPBCC family protein [Chloroflexota bacterium]
MSLHRFEDSQFVPIGRDEAWAFFSDPRNLARITPPGMGFRLLDAPSEQIYPGLILRYRVRPLVGVPVTWVTEITHVREGEYFVDEQRLGPYRLWHHQHHFTAVPGGVEVGDVVHYVLPFGALGALLNRIVVGPRVRDIFAYRRATLARLFGARAPGAEHASARGGS